MTIIAMGRELGSRGKTVAEAVAEVLGASLIHYEIIDHLADRGRVRKSHVARLLEPGIDPFVPLTSEDTLPTMLSATEIFDIASIPEDVVLRGWGAVALLRGVRHVARVRITAPLENRVRNLMADFKGVDDARVREEIALFDEAHAAVLKRHFNVDYRDPALYELVLDTSQTPVFECANHIVEFTRARRNVETNTSRLRLVSLSTEAHVTALLRLHPPTRPLKIDVAAQGGAVTLSGMVPSTDLRIRCEEVAWRVPGIESVNNELSVAA